MMAARNRHIRRRIVTRIRSVLLLTLPGAGRRRGTAPPPPARRDATVPSGARSAPRRPGHSCRNVARKPGRKRRILDGAGDTQPEDRRRKCPHPASRNARTRIECLSQKQAAVSGKPCAAVNLLRPRTLPAKPTTKPSRILCSKEHRFALVRFDHGASSTNRNLRERSSIRKDIDPTSIDGFWAPSWSISGGPFTQASMNPGRSLPIKKGFAPM
jgi:hypothetical protein